MALKYQALNGTVISKTTTTVIEGFNVDNPNTPSFIRGITDDSGNVCSVLAAMYKAENTDTSPTFTAIVAQYYQYSFSTTYKDDISKTITYEGRKFRGGNFDTFVFMGGAGAYSVVYSGKFTLIYFDGVEQNIKTLDIPVNASGMSYDSTSKKSGVGFILKLPNHSNRVILGLTYTPPATE